MFRTKTYHVCTIHDEGSDSFLPPHQFRPSLTRRLRRFCRKLILVAEYNPQSSKFFFSPSAITAERKKQVETGSWIIHPFSVFRLYYEMWMAVIFLVCIIYMPLQATYEQILGRSYYLNGLLRNACIVDIIINFFTGYCLPSHEVEMEPKKIAKNYIFGPYFAPDVLSSLPQLYFSAAEYLTVTNYLGMLKIVRLMTCLMYTVRTLNFFKIKPLYFKIGILSGLLAHYAACFVYFLPLVFMKYSEGLESYERYKYNTTLTTKQDYAKFLNIYMECMYYGASYLLGADLRNKFQDPWISYFFAIIQYMLGKIFVGFLTVILLEAYRLRTCIEYKYYAMMSQIDAFMSANQFSHSLQIRVRQYYAYKYHMKYFNESRIDRFISEKLRKEIKYQNCQILVQNVAFFESIPREILENIIIYLKKEIYLAKDMIIRAGQTGDCMYFLSSGTVAVSSPSGKEICHLKDGDYFGEISLVLPGVKTTANITALEICELYTLDRRSFRKCFETQADLYRQIQEEAKKRYFFTKNLDKAFMDTFQDKRYSEK